jgi:hypothetical protein
VRCVHAFVAVLTSSGCRLQHCRTRSFYVQMGPSRCIFHAALTLSSKWMVSGIACIPTVCRASMFRFAVSVWLC